MSVANPTNTNTNTNTRNGLARRIGLGLSAARGTWRWQASLFVWLLAVLAGIALIVAIVVTNIGLQTFERISKVAVPSINATNDATQSLSSEVANTAEYILAVQYSKNESDRNSRKQELTAAIRSQQARYDQRLQDGYQALTTYRNEVNPSVDAALRGLSVNRANLNDALAQARGLADQGQLDQAIQTYLNGQTTYYPLLIANLYYLRSVHIVRLENAEREAGQQAVLLQNLAIGLAALFTLALIITNVWLTWRIKRVFVPLVNIALILMLVYALLLTSVLTASRNNLSAVIDSYKTTALLSDAQLYLTDAAADQVQWVIGGRAGNAAAGETQFVGDPVYEQDFKIKTTRLLSVQQGTADPVVDPKLVGYSCNTPLPTGYVRSGVMADVCKNLYSDREQALRLDRFVAGYGNSMRDDANFRAVVTSGRIEDGLVNRFSRYDEMMKSLNDLKTRNISDYNRKSTESTDSLNLIGQAAWLIYPLALLLAGVGVLSWRREF